MAEQSCYVDKLARDVWQRGSGRAEMPTKYKYFGQQFMSIHILVYGLKKR